ncbi:MAG: 30S ribosomal protein S4 [Candidatus Jordarchaeum sp.]|uniref:30S ribosomal protein S4 n=1 Tax=Candidatus Jordarchaeum sp. TaxID=2823881 RepID=UPI0040495FD2
MGDPKRQKKKFRTPRHPWQKDRIHNELILVGKYGLRNKREIWRANTMLRGFRNQARRCLALPEEEEEKARSLLVGRLHRLGILPLDASLDDVLLLAIEDLLNRRLQTLVHKHGLSTSIYHARQLITHGHIAVDGRRVTSPGYLVPGEEEELISFASSSPLSDPNHPERIQTSVEE